MMGLSSILSAKSADVSPSWFFIERSDLVVAHLLPFHLSTCWGKLKGLYGHCIASVWARNHIISVTSESHRSHIKILGVANKVKRFHGDPLSEHLPCVAVHAVQQAEHFQPFLLDLLPSHIHKSVLLLLHYVTETTETTHVSNVSSPIAGPKSNSESALRSSTIWNRAKQGSVPRIQPG